MQARPHLSWMMLMLMLMVLALPGWAQTRETSDSRSLGLYRLPASSDIIGRIKVVEAAAKDTLIDIGLRHGVGFEAMQRANPSVDAWVPGKGTEVRVPTRFILPPGPHKGIVINLAELRLYYYPPVEDGETPRVETFPIGIGRQGWQTPLGKTTVTMTIKNPAWYPPESIIKERAEDGKKLPRVVPPGPDNPLGEYAMMLDIPGYLIHGTNQPRGVGMRVSHGCIRMLPRDIEYLATRVPNGTQVRIIDEPVKFGWDAAGTLFAQLYPVKQGGEGAVDIPSRTHAMKRLHDTVKQPPRFLIDFGRLEALRTDPDGIPTSLLLTGLPFPMPEPPQTFFTRTHLSKTFYNRIDASLQN